ncbi:MAG: endonuclease/exonuclease/phosphatase family protein [Bacteroidota bacterium]
MATIKKKRSVKPKNKTSLATRLMIVANTVFICLLLFSYASLYISPERFWPISFAGLAYPLILMSNLFFVLFWLVFLKKYFILSLITILLGYNQIKTCIKFSGPDHTLSFENSIKVMTYNIRLFDLYNWRNGSGSSTRSAIFDLIHSESPDILCLQEYYSGVGKHADFADTICLKSGYKYRSIELINKDGKDLPYGLAIFSKYPVVHTQRLVYPNSTVNFCQSVDIKIGKDTIRVLNLHLESVKFGKEDYNFVSEITNSPANNDKLKKGSQAILGKMKYAYIKRAVQIRTIADFISKSPYPVLLNGDFNDTPVSYSYRQISNLLEDSFVEAGKGLGQTYAEKLPLLRIDYIFHSKVFRAIEYKSINKDYSDHFPVVARFVLPG